MKYYKIFYPILILLCLIVPLLHMNTEEISKQENRTLVKFPQIKKKNKINLNYNKDFESWLGDRFWGRGELIDIWFQSLYKINGRIENKRAFIGDDGWMFEKSKTLKIPSVKKQREKIKKDAKTLKKFSDKLKGKNVPIYLVIEPNREQMYKKYWERYHKPKQKLDYAEELKKALKNYSNIKIIYPQEEFETGGKNYFHKDDVHLNGDGSELLARSTLKFLKIDEGKYTIKQQENSTEFNIASKLGFKNVIYSDNSKKILVTYRGEAKYEKLEKAPKGFRPQDLYELGKSEKSSKNEKLYLLGVCYSRDSLFPFLKYVYRETELITIYPVLDKDRDYYNFRLEKIKDIYRDKGNFSIIIVLSSYPEQEIKMIEDSLSD